jgi:hypothetical protein
VCAPFSCHSGCIKPKKNYYCCVTTAMKIFIYECYVLKSHFSCSFFFLCNENINLEEKHNRTIVSFTLTSRLTLLLTKRIHFKEELLFIYHLMPFYLQLLLHHLYNERDENNLNVPGKEKENLVFIRISIYWIDINHCIRYIIKFISNGYVIRL